jgi:HPt (histidine-containing phosphotransfer) domain-containing protein
MPNLEKNNQVYTASINDGLYDLSILEEMDDAEYLLDILNALLQETPVDIKEMKEGLRSGKTDTVRKMAHKLKSSAGTIQAGQLTSVLEEIESSCKKNIPANDLGKLVENAVSLYSHIESALKVHVKELSKLT